MPSIVFLTDFGPSEYPGIMEAAARYEGHTGPVVHLTHGIRPQNVLQAGFILANSISYMPTGAIIAAVVDPGVGTDRRIIAAEVGSRIVIAPDNGLLTPLFDQMGQVWDLDYTGGAFDPSFTFHGRDVFAPAAARWAAGGQENLPLKKLSEDDLTVLRDFTPAIKKEHVLGKILHIDHFGNCISNIPADLPQLRDFTGATLMGVKFRRWLSTYSEAGKGDPVLVTSSYGTLEFALRDGHYADTYGINFGDRVEVSFWVE